MNLHCPYCNERIVARSFGKCPGCYRDLPEELKIGEREKAFDEMKQAEWQNSLRAMKPDTFSSDGISIDL